MVENSMYIVAQCNKTPSNAAEDAVEMQAAVIQKLIAADPNTTRLATHLRCR